MDALNKGAKQDDEKLEVIKYKKPNPNKKFWVLLLITLILLAGMYFWKQIEVSKAKRDAEKEIEANELRVRHSVINAHEEHLKLLAKPIVWAIRSEIMTGNTGQVSLYSNELVKEKGFQQITIVDDKGTIVSATDKKNEGLSFSAIGKTALLHSNITIVENIGDTAFIVSSPVMGFNSRLGTLIMSYKIPVQVTKQ